MTIIHLFRRRFQRLHDTGIVSKALSNYFPRVDKCLVESDTKPLNAVYSFADLSSVFFLFAVGIALTCFVFLVERLYYWRENRQKKRSLQVSPTTDG